MAKLYTYGIYIDIVMCIPRLVWASGLTCWETDERRGSRTNPATNTPVMEGDMTVRERKRGRLPYQTPQDWDYLLHQSAIAQQKWTGNNTVKPSVYLNTRRSIKYKSSSQPRWITGICSVKIKSYMCSYKIFIYMLWWYVRIYSNIGISRVVRTATFSCRYHLDWNFTKHYSNFDTTVKIYMLLNKVLNLIIKVKLHTHTHTHTHTHIKL